MLGEIPRQPPGFQQRAELMRKLEQGGPGAPGGARLVTGAEGAGRTQLAAAHARARLARGWLVAWINAKRVEDLLDGLAEIHRALGLAPARDEREAGQAVRHWLETNGDRCLVVFDDLDDAELVRPFSSAAGKAEVIAVCDPGVPAGWGAGWGAEVRVGGFMMAEALAFLAERTGSDDEAGAREVAQRLGCLPSALAHAAGVIVESGLGYKDYLERVRSVRDAALAALKAARSDEHAGQVLDLLAVLSPAGVGRSLLHAGQASSAAVDRSLDRLAALGLITFGLQGCEVAADRRVRNMVRERLAATKTLGAVKERAVARLEARARELWPQRFARRAEVRELVRQIDALPEATRLRWWAATFLNELKDSPLYAIRVARSLADDQARVHGGEHVDALAARDNLATTYRLAGRLEAAIALCQQVLRARERVLGAEHPDTLASANNLALAYRCAERVGEAIALHQQTLAARQRVLGTEHRSTLASANNLALAYRSAGRVGEAITLHQQTLAARERVLGTEHPDTLASANNLALAYRSAGRVGEAITLHQQTLAARERVLGTEHPDTVASRENLARAYRSAGRVAEAAAARRQRGRTSRWQAPTRVIGTEELVIQLAAKGLTPERVAALLAAVHRVVVPARSVSVIVERAVDGMARWCDRPLAPVYHIVFLDTIRVRIAGSGRPELPVCLAVGVTARGERDILGLWAGGPGDFWPRTLSEIQRRGPREVVTVVADGIAGVREAVTAVWSEAVVTSSMVHTLRRSPLSLVRQVSKRDWNEMARDIKPVYLASGAAEALERFDAFAARWAGRYPAVVARCRRAWPDVLAFLELDQRTRIMITTNAVEMLGAGIARSVRARGRFASEQDALRHLYLVVTQLDPAGRARARWMGRWNATVTAAAVRRSWPAPSATPATAPASTADPRDG